jgi:diguanylate cyclase (GGDEF)-like protein
MNFFNWIKKYTEKLRQVEDKIYRKKTEFVEIYQKNLVLEEEIMQRTEELRKANQTLLTLEHVWGMMNSSRPLSSVLEAIVASLHGEFGYLYSCIFQKQADETGEFLKVKTHFENDFTRSLAKQLKKPNFDNVMHYKEGGLIDRAIISKKVLHTNKIAEFITEIFPAVSIESACFTQKDLSAKSIIVLPIVSSKEFCGALAVFAPRSTPSERELDFLSLFVRQIELAITIANLFETVKKQAVTDPLTGLFNRRFYEDALAREAVRSLRQKQPFTLIALDLDYLKTINDKFGHTTGDKAICACAKAIAETARSLDIAARVGGEEFVIILPGVDSQGGMVAAERLRATIEASKVDLIGKITASIGVATFIEQTLDADELTELSDRAMYEAKKGGRNRVELAKTAHEISWQDIAVTTFVDILEKHRIPFNADVAKTLSEKLKSSEEAAQSNTTKEALYSVVDTISQTYTPTHRKGVSKEKVSMASRLAKKMKLQKTDADKLKIATLLYDIGNTLVPQDILKKPESLTEDEKEQIAAHPVIAAQEILKPIGVVSDIIPIIEHHHENWDGSGYPNNIKGNDIPMTSQIILIVDSYFAMTSERPYRHALAAEEALDEIRKSAGVKYSQKLVDEFVKVVREG